MKGTNEAVTKLAEFTLVDAGKVGGDATTKVFSVTTNNIPIQKSVLQQYDTCRHVDINQTDPGHVCGRWEAGAA